MEGALLFDKEVAKCSWDPYLMIDNAKALQKVANQLAPDQESPMESDIFLFTGKIMVVPILLSLATEIALKAWQCRERKKAPYTHDLLKLFEGLSEGAQIRLEEELPMQLDPVSIRLGAHELCPVGAGMRKILEFHRKAFECWRYTHESMRETFYTPVLNEALTVIIETYNQTYDRIGLISSGTTVTGDR